MINYVSNKSNATFDPKLVEHVNNYSRYGFRVTRIVSDRDGSITASKDMLPNVEFSSPGAGSHVSEIERRIQAIKGIARSVVYDLLYKLVKFMLIWIALSNLLVTKGGYQAVFASSFW